MGSFGDTDDRGLVAAGEVVGGYRIGCLIATGGFGAVYRAQRVEDGQLVALKLIHQFRLNSENVHRFQREVEALRRLEHKNVVKLFDVGLHTDERPFLVMEFLNGLSLDRYLANEVRLSLPRALEILEPVCEALSVAHAAEIVHRDIKASNIFLENWGTPEQRVVLLDFGLVKLLSDESMDLTTSRHRIGTPFAMAPEQIVNTAVDARTDVYGLGNLAFLMLTGQLPFASAFSAEMQEMHLHATVPDPCTLAPIAPGVGAAIMRAMEKEARYRFGSVLQFRDALCSRGLFGDNAVPEVVVAAYVELTTNEDDPDDIDDDLLDDMENLMALVGRFFVQASFETMISSGKKALFVQPYESKPVELSGKLEDLVAELENRPAPNPLLHWKLCLHAASRTRCEDGSWRDELSATDSWVPAGLEGLAITREAKAALGLPDDV